MFEAVATKTKRILIVDDERAVVQALSVRCEHLGLEVRVGDLLDIGHGCSSDSASGEPVDLHAGGCGAKTQIIARPPRAR